MCQKRIDEVFCNQGIDVVFKKKKRNMQKERLYCVRAKLLRRFKGRTEVRVKERFIFYVKLAR